MSIIWGVSSKPLGDGVAHRAPDRKFVTLSSEYVRFAIVAIDIGAQRLDNIVLMLNRATIGKDKLDSNYRSLSGRVVLAFGVEIFGQQETLLRTISDFADLAVHRCGRPHILQSPKVSCIDDEGVGSQHAT